LKPKSPKKKSRPNISVTKSLGLDRGSHRIDTRSDPFFENFSEKVNVPDDSSLAGDDLLSSSDESRDDLELLNSRGEKGRVDESPHSSLADEGRDLLPLQSRV